MKHPDRASERSFGILFLIVTGAIGILGLYRGWAIQLVAAFFLASMLLGLATLFHPPVLAPLNKGWFLLGRVLGKVVSPIILGVLYFGLLTPIALVARAFGRDELRLKRQQVNSYWLERSSSGPPPSSFENQF